MILNKFQLNLVICYAVKNNMHFSKKGNITCSYSPQTREYVLSNGARISEIELQKWRPKLEDFVSHNIGIFNDIFGFGGITGNTGIQGSTSSIGIQGVRGSTGSIGIQGVQGSIGVVGNVSVHGIQVPLTTRGLPMGVKPTPKQIAYGKQKPKKPIKQVLKELYEKFNKPLFNVK